MKNNQFYIIILIASFQTRFISVEKKEGWAEISYKYKQTIKDIYEHIDTYYKYVWL